MRNKKVIDLSNVEEIDFDKILENNTCNFIVDKTILEKSWAKLNFEERKYLSFMVEKMKIRFQVKGE